MLSRITPMFYQDRLSLKARVLGATIWTLVGYGVSQAIRLGGNLLLTRLLVPDMFGVIAVAIVVLTGLGMVSDVGLRQNVVQSTRGSDPVYLNTGWVTQIIRGGLLCTVGLALALLVFAANQTGLVPDGSVYADRRLPAVIAASSMSLVITGFESTKLYEASRGLSLHRVTQIDLAAQIFGLLVVGGWAFVDRSVWTLVAGSICSVIVRTILSHTWLPGVPNRWQWDGAAFGEIFQFGKWMFLSSGLGFLVNCGDRLLLGGMIDATQLGVYAIAFLILSSIETSVSRLMGEVSFPALSEVVRLRPVALKEIYYRFHIPFACFSYFSAGLLMVSGEAIVRLLYDHRYEQAGWILQILAAILLTIPFRLATQAFLSLGLPRLFCSTLAVRLSALLAATPVGFYFFGLPGALAGIVLSHFLYIPTIVLYQIKNGIFDLRRELLLLPIIAMGVGAAELLLLPLIG
jgi:O-antigen/teichoic acid export membrane protein